MIDISNADEDQIKSEVLEIVESAVESDRCILHVSREINPTPMYSTTELGAIGIESDPVTDITIQTPGVDIDVTVQGEREYISFDDGDDSNEEVVYVGSDQEDSKYECSCCGAEFDRDQWDEIHRFAGRSGYTIEYECPDCEKGRVDLIS